MNNAIYYNVQHYQKEYFYSMAAPLEYIVKPLWKPGSCSIYGKQSIMQS